jgi:hypothetical protein
MVISGGSRGSSKHRPGFHLTVLTIGFIVGGFLTTFSRRFLPAGAVKEFLTTGVTPSFGPLSIDLVILKFALGPVALDVSLLSLAGVLVAYLIARSLF